MAVEVEGWTGQRKVRGPPIDTFAAVVWDIMLSYSHSQHWSVAPLDM
jgi:hypothetical protein